MPEVRPETQSRSSSPRAKGPDPWELYRDRKLKIDVLLLCQHGQLLPHPWTRGLQRARPDGGHSGISESVQARHPPEFPAGLGRGARRGAPGGIQDIYTTVAQAGCTPTFCPSKLVPTSGPLHLCPLRLEGFPMPTPCLHVIGSSSLCLRLNASLGASPKPPAALLPPCFNPFRAPATSCIHLDYHWLIVFRPERRAGPGSVSRAPGRA